MKNRQAALVGALCLLTLPLAAAAKDKATPASPKGGIASWFPQDIYPPEAKRKGEQGRVTVQLAVANSGNATACKVVESSGSSSLDARTCELALANARFNPAMDATGRPVATTYTLPAIRWILEDDYTNLYLDGGPVTTTRSVEVIVDAQGKGLSCAALADASGVKTGCAGFRPGTTITPPLLLNNKPVSGKVTITTTTRVEPK